MRKEGKHIKRWCFDSKASELVKGKYPGEVSCFKLSCRWFEGFCRRYRVSLRRQTYVAQKSPAALRTTLEKFLAKSLQEREKDTFTPKFIFQPKAWCDEAIMKKWVEED